MNSKLTKQFFISLLLIVAIAFSLVGCDSAEDHVGEAKTPSGSGALKGRQYSDVVEDFEENGFTNIKLDKIEDLVTGWMTKDGEVEKVSVGGDEEYSPDKWVVNNIEVIITYHTFPEKKESSESGHSGTSTNIDETDDLINPPYTQADARYLDYKLVEEAFKSAGFTNVVSRLTHMSAEQEIQETAKPGEVASISIGSSYINDTNTKYSKNDTVYIDYYVLFSYDPLDKLVSDEELSEHYAKTALEKHGNNEYEYGIKYHWATNLINSEQNTDGSWFLKVGVTITKSDGSKYDTVAEGVVSGTDKNPKVAQFHISE